MAMCYTRLGQTVTYLAKNSEPASRARGRGVARPILAVTASALEEQEQKSRAAGLDCFIHSHAIVIEAAQPPLDVWLKDAADESTPTTATSF